MHLSGEKLLSSLRRSLRNRFLRLFNGEASNKSDQVREILLAQSSDRRHDPLAFTDDSLDVRVSKALYLLRTEVRDRDTERLGHGGLSRRIRAVADRTLVHKHHFPGRHISLAPRKRTRESQEFEKNYGRYAFHLNWDFLFDRENGIMT
jgi:hypothetical protein